jgi:UDP-glucose 4-epimerase
MKMLVTGGAGFIGSHLLDALIMQGHDVVCLDNFSSGRREFIVDNLTAMTLVEGDMLDPATVEAALDGCDTVFHLAANPDVRSGATDTATHFDNNIRATYNLLEAMRKTDVRTIAFTSSSTVYGEASVIPTPEHYGPLIPISLYGASKLASEALIAAYCHTFDMRGVIYRFANVVGPRSTHGVIFDFVGKLKTNPRMLEILGDGTQKKSYLYIDDCVRAMLVGLDRADERVELYNIGTDQWTEVRTIADIVAGAMHLSPDYAFTGGEGGRGWKGDVKFMRLDCSKLRQRGWTPAYTSNQAVEKTATWLLEEME